MPIQTETRHTLPANLGHLPLDALRHDGRVLLAVQTGLFAEDERAWAHDDGGQWRGPAPCRAVPSDLRIEGTTSYFFVGADDIARVASGAEVWASCELMEAGGTIGGAIEFRLQDAVSGAQVGAATSGAIPARVSLGALPDGCYLLLARLAGASASFRLPPGYARSPIYNWGAGDADYWDYLHNVGRFPPPDHPFWGKRAELLDNNAQTDVPAWADYIIANADDERGGEWSARGFVVGAGAWQPSPDLVPLCGPSLFEVESVNARAPVPVEPFARSGNVLNVSDAGELWMAGQRMTPSGLNACLWKLVEGAWVLLGANENPSTGMCECALANHGPTSIVFGADGRVYVLTKCSLHVYDAGADRINERLPGVPLASGGHPGGHSLVEIEGRQYFTSENFGQTDWSDASGRKRAQFYDFLSIQAGEQRAAGPGTVFHGTNDLTAYVGRLWGVMQDKPHSDTTARQFVTWFDGGDWSFETSLVYPAKFFRWQRLCGVEGLPDFTEREQQILLAFGKLAASEGGIVGVGDGREFTWNEWPYRIRRASVCSLSAHNSVMVIARACDGEAIDQSAWHLLEIVAAQTGDGDETGGGGETPDERPLPPPDAGALVVRLQARQGRAIHAVQIGDAGRERLLETYNREFKAVWYRVDSTAPPDDLSSYEREAPMGRREMLPRSGERVDVLFYLPPESSERWDEAPDVATVVVRRA